MKKGERVKRKKGENEEKGEEKGVEE